MPTDINRNIVAVSGPRDAEWQLLESLRSAHASGPGQLKPGVLVITASGALRRRLARRIAEDRNGAVLGIEVTTLSTVVGRLLAREADVEQPTEWFELIVRRALADQLKNLEPPLAFDDAAGSLVSSVRDLISAGLEPELADDLAQLAASPNAAIVVKAAASCLRELRRLHVGRNSERMRRATEILRDSGHQVLNDRRVFILGFADAPGRTTAFLRGLIEITDARLLLEMPQSFGRGSEQAVRALPGRFARNLGFADLPTPPSAERWPALAAFDASGRSATARELMWRLRETIDAGRRPEDIVVGLRGMETWASSLRRHAEELGVPISGGELPTGYTAASRRTASILELIRRGPQAMASEFIESMGPSVDTELCRRWDLAARALGRSRVADLAGLEVLSTLGEDAIFKLPSRPGSGMMISASGELTERRHAARRVTRDELHQLETRASRWLEFLSAASTPAPAAQQARQLVQAIEAGLGWPSLGDQETPDWLSEIPRLAHELGTCLLVDRDEFVTLLAARWRALGKEGLGGLGGGVQILELAQARGLACEELFVLGMERGVLPATGREDPWLPDAVRRRLRERLPQLGLAAERRDEEAHLFASLLAAAPHVTLIRQRCDEDGKELAASPYLAPAMQDADDPSEPIPRPLPALFERSRSRRRPLPAREAALAFGLAGDELNWADRLDHSHTEARQRFGVPPRRTSDTLGSRGEAHRLRLAFDRPIAMLSPWMGRVGLPSAGDPRGDAPWVTTLERVHRCPWQAFLMGVLQLRPTPEWHDKLPGIDRLLIGNAVHRAMEIHAEGRGTDDQPDLDATSLHALLARAAREEAGRLGISLAGFQRALIAVIRPYVELALHELRGQALVASEREGRLEVKDLRRDGTFHLQFRVDQVRTENGRPVLVDYKTGRTPPSEAVKPETRRKYLVRGLREGSLLQGMAYALSSGGEGRYVYLHPDIREDCRTWPVSADDKELVDHFLVAANLAHSALARGVLPARMDMADGKANEACGNCEFKPACHLDDSGARMRLREFSQQLKSRAGARTPTDTDDGIHCDLWHHGRETSA